MLRYTSFLVACCCIAAVLSLGTSSCQKMDRPEMIIIPDDTAKLNGPLQRALWFEESAIDSISYEKGTATGATYVDGIHGKAYKGATNAMITYSATEKMATLTSFTVSLWINTNKHGGGAQCVFMLPRTSDFWGNLFMLIEGNDNAADNSMLVKFSFGGLWAEFNGNANSPARVPDAYGKWKHFVFRYDETTSKFNTFVDGVAYPLPAGIENRTKVVNNTEVPYGPLEMKDVSRFVIGAYQQHLGAPWGAADSWMLKYTGMLDQFRFYTVALSDADITALYNSKL